MSQAAAAPAADAPKKKGSKLVIIVAAVALLAGGGGAWFYLQQQKAKEGEPEHVEVKKTPPVFHPMETFTVNLADRERYLQLGIVFEARDSHVVEALKAVNPVVRGKILLVLSAKGAEELLSVEGKKALAEQLLAVARESLPAHEPKGKEKGKAHDESRGIDDVHFSSFVIQ